MFWVKFVTGNNPPEGFPAFRLLGLGAERHPSGKPGSVDTEGETPLLRAAGSSGRKRPTLTGDAVGGAPVENHPLEERVVIDILLGPRGGQAAGAAAFLLAQLRLVQDLAAAVFGLAEPAIPSCEETGGRWVSAAGRGRRAGRGGRGVEGQGTGTSRGRVEWTGAAGAGKPGLERWVVGEGGGGGSQKPGAAGPSRLSVSYQ